MKKTLAQKIIDSHEISRQIDDVVLKVDQTLTQDSTGTMVYLQLLALGVDRIKTECSVAYIDHNMLQAGFENADDHAFIRSVANKMGVLYSKPGNGICHQLHLERFSKPGKVLIGSDSHTPTCGAVGMLAMGAGGLDVAVGMAYGTYKIKQPRIIGVNLTGKLKPWVSAKDVILTLLGKLSVKGGVGAIMEYYGDGVVTLSVTERATITNMGAELGATTSIFPSDERTLEYFTRQGRPEDYEPLSADLGAEYDAVIDIDLSTLTPMAAKPHSPDFVEAVTDIGPIKVDQVAIGSCTNSSYEDLMRVAQILKGKKVAEDVSLVISPGSSNILKMMADNGALGDLIAAGARILEASCGPCIGMGQAPKTEAISLRTFNRNFKGRCGTESASVYLVSPETAALSALTGVLTCPSALKSDPSILSVVHPDAYEVHSSYFIAPSYEGEVVMGPNIQPFPLNKALESDLSLAVLLVTQDNITTDDIVPSSAQLLPLRSNIPELSKHCFEGIDTGFYARAKTSSGGVIIGGENYGQGSSREHAALVPLYLGIKAVLAKSFARIHKANLINSGILPLVFINPDDYQRSELGMQLNVSGLLSIDDQLLLEGFTVTLQPGDVPVGVKISGTPEDLSILRAGGLINIIKAQHAEPKSARHSKRTITLIKGDGIGPEVTESAKRVLGHLVPDLVFDEVNAGLDTLKTTGSLVPEAVYESIEKTRVILKGPITTPVGEGFRSINVSLRKKYDLFCNIRPILSISGVLGKYEALDLVIFRENTEDLYAGVETHVDDDTRHSLKVITRAASERIILAAFDYARTHHRRKVTLVHKANIMKETDGLFLEVGRELAKGYSDIHFEDLIVDNMCMQLVMDPNQFDIIVTTNLYGDILSDLCAGLVGGLGLVPGANIGHDTAMFEPVHGSAPDIAGKNKANPTAMLLSSAMMLDYLGEHNAAKALRTAINHVLNNPMNHTADLGGHCATTQFTDAILKALANGGESYEA